jgi:hypothetical protein
MVREIDTTWRVYHKEWLLEGMFETEADARAHLEERFGGRLQPEDMSVEQTYAKDAFSGGIRVWNVSSEWKRQSLAEGWMAALIEEGYDPERLRTVERNSRAETMLLNYGKLLLPA